tara:strand:+ start:833 stop:1255 length:423 start_codon:yes stop_codon:yes gene_type:complete
VRFDPESDPVQILAQPVVVEFDSGIGIGLGAGFLDQRFEGDQFMSDPREHRALTVRVGKREFDRNETCQQAWNKQPRLTHRRLPGLNTTRMMCDGGRAIYGKSIQLGEGLFLGILRQMTENPCVDRSILSVPAIHIQETE